MFPQECISLSTVQIHNNTFRNSSSNNQSPLSTINHSLQTTNTPGKSTCRVFFFWRSNQPNITFAGIMELNNKAAGLITLDSNRISLSGKKSIREFLRAKSSLYNQPAFIGTDPIQIPHRFTRKEDIEISAFLAAVIAWGQRRTIINNANRLMTLMDETPHDFILNFQEKDLKPFEKFVHRTFNGDDCLAFLHALQRIYRSDGGLEEVFATALIGEKSNPGRGLSRFKSVFLSGDHLPRTRKHLPDPLQGSAAKRMNMYLRWMVRRDDTGVDFGIWNTISPASLYIPLDVHTARVARKLGILQRPQDDWKAVIELTQNLRKIDPADPARLDFALFGLGAFEKF
jgi:uncharacterized protein (TIGR02757 family)